ncbi:MAG: tripartite tricarboxylate transporter substrate-binding protein, partial [Burkholderiales bacterium]
MRICLGLMVAFVFAGTACGQSFPVKPVRMVTTEAGGGTDFATRLIAQGITQGFGQQVVVDNRPSGVIPGETVAKAPPDGYTLLVSTQIVWLLPFMQHAPFDPLRDFIPVTLAVTAPTVLVVHPSL